MKYKHIQRSYMERVLINMLERIIKNLSSEVVFLTQQVKVRDQLLDSIQTYPVEKNERMAGRVGIT